MEQTFLRKAFRLARRIYFVPHPGQSHKVHGLTRYNSSLPRSSCLGERTLPNCEQHFNHSRATGGINSSLTTFTRLLSYDSKSDSSSNLSSGSTRTLKSDSHSSVGASDGGEVVCKEVVYMAPLKGAIRALKVFSLTTATATLVGSPVLVWVGNPSVPLVARVMMSFVVMFAGLGTTGLLHWMLKGYVIKMEYTKKSGEVTIYTLSLLAMLKKFDFHISESGPPSKAIAFSSFQARDKPFFLHTEVFKDRELLSKLLGAYSVFEESLAVKDANKSKDN